MTIEPILGAEGVSLANWWAPVLMVLIFIGWAWVASAVYDKDAARYLLPRRGWNAVHLAAGVVALLLIVALPLPGFITISAAAAVLGADLVAYFMFRNKSERVPAKDKWTLDWQKIKQAREAKKKGKAASTVGLIFKGPKGELPVPERATPEYDLRVAAEELFQKMVDQRGTQLDGAPVRDGSYIFGTLVDGVRLKLEQMPAPRALAIVDLFKAAAGLDVADKRRKQIGDFKLGPPGPSGLFPARLTTQGGAAGVQMSLLLDPEGQVKRTIEGLGLLENQLEDLKAMLEERKGVVLLAAPPDSGRTSTLYAILRAHDAYTCNVQTIEIDQQAALEGVRQNKFDARAEGAEYSTTVRSILRRDPDIVAVAEMPDDGATAKEVARADHERTRVYFSFPCDGALGAIQMYVKAVGDQAQAAKSLHGVIAHRLLRRLCQNCRVPFQPPPDMIKKLGLPADTKQMFRKSGQLMVRDKPQTCVMCNGSGFFGQVGVFEVHPLGAPERDMIAANDLTGLRATFRSKRQQGLQAAALQLAIRGDTSVEELVRLTQPVGASPESPPAAQGEQKPAPTAPKPGAPAPRPGAPAPAAPRPAAPRPAAQPPKKA